MTDILTWESDEIRELFDQLKKIEEEINLAKENYHPSIASDYYLTGEDVRRILHISVRTLQNLRDTRQIPYTVIGGKYLYPEEELLKAMKKNYRNCRHQK